MGTNYYLKCPPCECCGRRDADYHLGKSSGGWTFSFHGNKDPDLGPVITTAQEWEAHIRAKLAEGWTIQNEYGRDTGVEELLALIERKQSSRLSHAVFCERNHPEDVWRGRTWLDPDGNSFTAGEFS